MLRQAAALALVAVFSGLPAAGTVCELLCDEPAANAGTSPCHPSSTDAGRLTATAHCDHASAALNAAVLSAAAFLLSSDTLLSPVAAYSFAGGSGPRAGIARTGPPGPRGTRAGAITVLRI
jgi:hypothetical protein